MGISLLLRVPQDNRPEGPSRVPCRGTLPFCPACQPFHVFTLAADCGRSLWLDCLLVSIALDGILSSIGFRIQMPLSQRAHRQASPGDELNFILLITNYVSRQGNGNEIGKNINIRLSV